MNESRWERYGAASGFAMVILGAAATVFERNPVTAVFSAASDRGSRVFHFDFAPMTFRKAGGKRP